MATIRIILREKKKDGTSPLTIRITKDRKSTYVYLDHCIRPEDWDDAKQQVKKSYRNHERLNNYIRKKMAEVSDTALELQTSKKSVSALSVKRKIKPAAGSTFFPQAELYLERLKETGKYNRYTADKPRIKHFKEFLKGEDIAFADVTVGLLNKFKAYLKSKLNISERTIMNHLVVIRSVFSQVRGVKQSVLIKE